MLDVVAVYDRERVECDALLSHGQVGVVDLREGSPTHVMPGASRVLSHREQCASPAEIGALGVVHHLAAYTGSAHPQRAGPQGPRGRK